MLANVDHGREQCVYLLFYNSLNCCVHFERFHNVFVVQSRSISPGFTEMLAAPVKLREAVVSDTAEDAKGVHNGDKEVRLKSEY